MAEKGAKIAPLDISGAALFSRGSDFAAWLAAHGQTEREIIVAIFNKASGKQTVTFDELLEVALCHGWIDVQTKRIDAETYAIRFVPRRPGGNWSATNRALVRRLLAEGRMTAARMAALPDDLDMGEVGAGQ